VAEGRLSATLDVDAYTPSAQPLEAVLPDLVELARALSTDAGDADRLFALFRGQDAPRVRASLLKLLARTHPEHAATRAACAAGLTDAHPWVRLEAAIGLGEAGRPTLRALATGRVLNDADTARAIEAVRAHLTVQDVASALGRARKGRQKGRRPLTARACIEALGAMGAPALRPLAGLVADADAGLAAQAADALGATGCAAAEAALLTALQRPEDDVREAAIRSLARVGTTAAILPLRAAEDEQGGFGRAAREAIAAIQARTGATAGQVTLADPTGEGRLSLARDVAGHVSIGGGGGGTGEG
jgi:HEAT repeat protein